MGRGVKRQYKRDLQERGPREFYLRLIYRLRWPDRWITIILGAGVVKYRDHACFKRILVHAHIYITYTHALSSTHVAPVRARAVSPACNALQGHVFKYQRCAQRNVKFLDCQLFFNKYFCASHIYYTRFISRTLTEKVVAMKNFISAIFSHLYLFLFSVRLCPIPAIPTSFCPMSRLRLPLFTHISFFLRRRDLNGAIRYKN